ncbi:MAG TPA: cytochrome c-type biogenesis CcmF C-terminal domain-containing protein [Acidimicrobiia bacterium]
MLAFLGSAGVAVALVGASLLVVRSTRVARGIGGADLGGPVKLVVAGAVVAMAAMQIALTLDDFSIAYLANNHAMSTPFPFDVATAWAALEGSILLWGMILAGYTWMVFTAYRKAPDRLGAAALAVMGAVAVFFFGLMITVANPFEVCVTAAERGCLASSPFPWAFADAPVDGRGPNPLLQNHIFMAIHPPLLYLGYVGLTAPFAYAIGALAISVPGPEWLRRSQRSTLLAWSFLSLGIVIGGWWAYEVLSWGGYWAWDPVENASFMPWLVATAFLHSALVQQRRGMLQAWNFVLVISAFALTILGTFITRSGTIASVHSFTQSAIGPTLLGFLVLVLVGSFTLLAQRGHLVASAPRIESLVSREGTFLANNLLLTVFAFVVLIGTMFPIILEAITGTRVGVRGPFFNRLSVPLSFLLLLLVGIGPVTPWAGADPGLIWKRIRGPLVAGLAAGVLVAMTVTRNGWVVLAVVLGIFVVGSIGGILFEQAERRRSKTGAGLLASAGKVVKGDARFWSGQLSHVGVVLVALGISFAANLSQHQEVVMAEGDRVTFAGHTITYQAPFQQDVPGKTSTGVRLEVIRPDGSQVTLEPRHNFFPGQPNGVATPAVDTRASGDLYVMLITLEGGVATLELDTSPLMWVLWLGGLTVAAGGFLSYRNRRQERTLVPRETVGV